MSLSNTITAEVPNAPEFHHFTINPGMPLNILSLSYLGRILRYDVQNTLIVDKYILHNQKYVDSLNSFLRHIKTTDDASVIIQTTRVKYKEKGNFGNWQEQDFQADQVKSRLRKRNIRIDYLSESVIDHDRLIYLHVKKKMKNAYYKIILGYGLFGFSSQCQCRSNVTWLNIPENDFKKEWFAANQQPSLHKFN